MGFQGKGALVAWHDIEPGTEAAHDDWHSHEHIAERLAIAGFRRGRRYRSEQDSPAFFILYEVDDLDVLSSPAYHERLNAPTAWTQRIVPTIRNMTRTLCRVRATHGLGVGAWAVSLRMRGEGSQRKGLIEFLGQQLAPSLVKSKGVVAAHLLEGDAAASGVPTDEMRLRGGGDQIADLALIVEGYDQASLSDLLARPLSETELAKRGASSLQPALHRLAHVVTATDL